jgi:hypothetical protein
MLLAGANAAAPAVPAEDECVRNGSAEHDASAATIANGAADILMRCNTRFTRVMRSKLRDGVRSAMLAWHINGSQRAPIRARFRALFCTPLRTPLRTRLRATRHASCASRIVAACRVSGISQYTASDPAMHAETYQ